jgi:spermidine synthase
MAAPQAEVIARADGVLGELALRRRGEVYELIVNGVFLMDSAETSTEELLAQVTLDRHPQPQRVLVGGLGLGFTVATLLADARVDRIDVVEIEPQLVAWLRSGIVPSATPVVGDPRVHIDIGDIRDALATAAPESYDGILLDVDNGPDFLVHEHNAAVYGDDVLRQAQAALAEEGMLAVWSSTSSQRLDAAMSRIFGVVDETVVDLTREGRSMTYHLYVAGGPLKA